MPVRRILGGGFPAAAPIQPRPPDVRLRTPGAGGQPNPQGLFDEVTPKVSDQPPVNPLARRDLAAAVPSAMTPSDPLAPKPPIGPQQPPQPQPGTQAAAQTGPVPDFLSQQTSSELTGALGSPLLLQLMRQMGKI